jgi:hypothetical protein
MSGREAMRIECHAELTGAQAAEWRAFLATARHAHPRQDPHFAAVERAEGHAVLHVLARAGSGAICAVGLFSLQRHPILPGAWAVARCLSGPVCDDAEAMVSFLDRVACLPGFSRTGRLSVTPFWTGTAAEELAARLAGQGWRTTEGSPFRSTGWVDLTRPAGDILAGFSKSARRELRRAERQGVESRPITDEGGGRRFLDSLNRLRRERRIGTLSEAGFMAAFRGIHAAGDLGVVIGAFHAGELIGGLQLYRSRDVAHGRQFTTEPARLRALANLRIAPLLWFEGMRWAQARGCRTLDVEGWRADAADDDPKYNIYKYKSEFSPTPVRRIAERSRSVNRMVDVSGNLLGDLRTFARGIKSRLT